MKRISISRLSAFFGTLILLLASCSKEAPIVPVPASSSSQPAAPPVPPAPACDSPCFVVHIPSTLDVSVFVSNQQWEEKGANRYAYPIYPSVAKVFPDLRYSDGFTVEFMLVNTNTGTMVIYPGAELIYGDGLIYFDNSYVYFSLFRGHSLPSSLTAILKLRFW